MSYIVNAIAWIIDFLFSKKGISTALLPLKVTAYGIATFAITLYISSAVLLANFILTLMNDFYKLVDNANKLSVVSGSAYGVSLSSILSATIGFISASGLGSAVYTASSLFFALLFLYMGYVISKQVADAFMTISTKLNEQIRTLDS